MVIDAGVVEQQYPPDHESRPGRRWQSLIFANNANSIASCPNKMKSIKSVIVALLGLCFVLLSCISVTRTLLNGYSVAQEMSVQVGLEPSRLAAVIGETLIALASLGLIAILPALLLYVALGPMRLRTGWFYSCAFLSSLYFLVLFPFGTIYGIILLVALRRRRGEFLGEVSSQLQVATVSASPATEHPRTSAQCADTSVNPYEPPRYNAS